MSPLPSLVLFWSSFCLGLSAPSPPPRSPAPGLGLVLVEAGPPPFLVGAGLDLVLVDVVLLLAVPVAMAWDLMLGPRAGPEAEGWECGWLESGWVMFEERSAPVNCTIVL